MLCFILDELQMLLGQENDKENATVIALCSLQGLGKSLAVVSLVHAFTRRQIESGNKAQVLVIVPTTLLINWSKEFLRWLPKALEEGADLMRVMVMETKTHKTQGDRVNLLKAWKRIACGACPGAAKKGSVLVMGYEMYKNLVLDHKESAKKRGIVELLAKAADLVVSCEKITSFCWKKRFDGRREKVDKI